MSILAQIVLDMECDTTGGMVTVEIEGKVINEQFARILVSMPDLYI